MSISKFAAEPIIWEFSGKKIKFRPLTLGNLATLEGWAREKVRNEQREFINELEDKGQRLELLKDLLRYGPSPMEINARMGSTEGQIYLLWLAAQKDQPKLTFDEMGQMLSLTDEEALQALNDALSGETKEEDDIIPPVTAPVEEPQTGA